MYVTGRQASLNSHYFPMDKHSGILSTDVFWFQGEIVNLGREVTAQEVQVVVQSCKPVMSFVHAKVVLC